LLGGKGYTAPVLVQTRREWLPSPTCLSIVYCPLATQDWMLTSKPSPNRGDYMPTVGRFSRMKGR
jgi:hypothetical protein